MSPSMHGGVWVLKQIWSGMPEVVTVLGRYGDVLATGDRSVTCRVPSPFCPVPRIEV